LIWAPESALTSKPTRMQPAGGLRQCDSGRQEASEAWAGPSLSRLQVHSVEWLGRKTVRAEASVKLSAGTDSEEPMGC
jgi:hypothetical protein